MSTAETWTAASLATPVQRCEDTPLETLAYVGGSRWPIETEFETEKGDVGLDEFETRSWSGWHHHIAMACLLPRSCTGWCGKCCPGNGSDRRSCCGGWRIRSYATSGRRSHQRRRSAHREGRMEPPP